LHCQTAPSKPDGRHPGWKLRLIWEEQSTTGGSDAVDMDFGSGSLTATGGGRPASSTRWSDCAKWKCSNRRERALRPGIDDYLGDPGVRREALHRHPPALSHIRALQYVLKCGSSM